jgi:uncharacterized membrane protein HdeD (DUF308 family)
MAQTRPDQARGAGPGDGTTGMGGDDPVRQGRSPAGDGSGTVRGTGRHAPDAGAGHGADPGPGGLLAEAGRHWGLLLFFSLLTIAAGVIAVAWPNRSLHLLAVLFGIQLLVTAGYEFVRAFSDHDGGIRAMRLLLAVMSVFAGILVLRHPFQTIALVVLVLGVLWTASGLVNTFSALAQRGPAPRGPALVSGIITLAAGIVLLSFPAPSVFAVAMLLGIMLIVVGVLGATAAWELRALARQSRPRSARHHRAHRHATAM